MPSVVFFDFFGYLEHYMNLQLGFNEIEVDALENKRIEAVWTYFPYKACVQNIVPDGRTDLIFTFRFNNSGQIDSLSPIIAAPFTQAHQIENCTNQGFIGLRLRTGEAHALLQAPLHRLTNKLIVGKEAIDHVPWLGDICRNKSTVKQLLENINRHICTAPSKTTRNMVQDALFLIQQVDGKEQVNQLADKLHVTERTLNRHFCSAVGLSPKQFLSIVRLRRAVSCLGKSSHTLASIALDCGFADQAHMTRELKSYMGYTPDVLKTLSHSEVLL